ncbi:fused MFS/spermidine synthase [soil metagenome]
MARRANAIPVDPPSVGTGVGTAEVISDRSRPGARMLLIDGQVHGHVDPADPGRLQLDYQARLAAIISAVLGRAGGGRVLHLGGGAFAVPRALQHADPSLRQVVVERSGAIIKLAERELGLRRDPALQVRKGDARAVLARCEAASAEVIAADAFVDGHTPRHLSTVEFLSDVARVLAPGGTYVVNLIDEQPWTVLGAHTATAGEVFADVLAVGSRGVARLRDPGNVFLLASATRMDREHLTSALVGGAHPSALVAAGQLTALARSARVRWDSDG